MAVFLADADVQGVGDDGGLNIDDTALPNIGCSLVDAASQYGCALGKSANRLAMVRLTLVQREMLTVVG